MIGARISHYKIVSALGSGGMGSVYQAEDLRLGRFVALKFLPEEFAADASTKARFHREARAASALNHPNICTIYEIGEEDHKSFIAMECLEGATLRRVLETGPLTLDRLLDIAVDISKGLDAAHSKGVIHRDIKPANIFVTDSGAAKILDFGLAKVTPYDGGAGPVDSFTTGPTLLGTVQYMSPEQALGKPVDARSDLFSFGILLYEMATGMLPFRGDSSPAILVSIIHDAPAPPLRLNSGLPKGLARIITRCLEKSPDRRYQTAAELRADLVAVSRGAGPRNLSRSLRITRALSIGRGSPAAARQTRAVAWISATAFAILAAVFALFYYRGAGVATLPEPEAPLTVRALSNLPGRKQRPIFSNDGNTVAFAWDGGDESRNPDVYLMLLDGGRPIQITSNPAGEWPQVFSPDGRRLYFSRQTEGNFASFWVPALGGDETRVADGIVTDISPDGRLAALVRPAPSRGEAGVFLFDLNASAEKRLANDFGSMDPKFTPDGKALYVQDGPDRDHLSVQRVAVAGGGLEPVRFAGLGAEIERIETIETSRRGGRILLSARRRGSNSRVVFVANADGSAPRRLPLGVPTGALSPDGRNSVAVRNIFDVNLYRVEAFPTRGRAAVPEKVLDTPREEYSPKFSPDRSRVLVSSFRQGLWEIWVWNASWTDGRPVFSRKGGTAGSPVWSPDGKWIAFDARTRNAGGDIWLAPASGGEAQMLVGNPEDEITPCFDPSSQWVYFTSSRTGTLQIFRVSVAGGPVTQVTQGGGFTCQFSEDGRYLYYLKGMANGGIWRLDTTNLREESVVPEMQSRNWQVLKQGIYLLDSQTNSQLGTAARPGYAHFFRFATGRITDLGLSTIRPVTHLGIEILDEKWLYFSQVDSTANELVLIENLP